MENNSTIIVVGVTETDGYGNLWVTPAGGGDKVKIGEKRSQLHPLFEQGKAVMLHWETYRNRPYVANAKLVEGELPPPVKPILPALEQAKIDADLREKPSGQEVGLWWKEMGEWLRVKEFEKGADPFWKSLRKAYFAQMFSVLNIKIEDKKENKNE